MDVGCPEVMWCFMFAVFGVNEMLNYICVIPRTQRSVRAILEVNIIKFE